MRIDFVQISNVLSFKYYENISLAPKITFEEGLNILIGQNGAGKSTALEVINFIFKRIIFVPYNINRDLFLRRDTLDQNSRKNTLRPNDQSGQMIGFRLDPNWNSADKPQKIVVKITLDQIDKNNLQVLDQNKSKLVVASGLYSGVTNLEFSASNDTFTIEIDLHSSDRTFSFQSSSTDDPGFIYLRQYEFYKHIIEIHNEEHPTDNIANLYESFTLISGYRNYNSFSPSVSLATESSAQRQSIRQFEVSRSTNANDQSEPSVFNLVRLRVAEKHYDTVFTRMDDAEAIQKANEEPFLVQINEKLDLINLKVEIMPVQRNTWSYSFNFVDTKRNQVLRDINSLSAGQKAIIHLIFEAYGRGELKGGVVIIDEPEIHLHYQFQYEYLKIIEKINTEQNSQFILVTHSEALISSQTIDKVKRFSLDENNYTTIKFPTLETDQKTLIKILDNTKSVYALFAKKVVLVEGDTDRYFFRAAFQNLKPALNQEIAIIDMGGKGGHEKWKKFFSDFGLMVYFIGDFDNVLSLNISGSTIVSSQEDNEANERLKQVKLDSLSAAQIANLKKYHEMLTSNTQFLDRPIRADWKRLFDYFTTLSVVPRKDVISTIKANRPDIDSKIESEYMNNIFILKLGTIEEYTGTSRKDLNAMICFCENIETWFSSATPSTMEIKMIIDAICS